MIKIAVEHVSKVFGPDPESVVPLIEQGLSKAEILEKTGHVVGLRDVSLEIEQGETFVVMGLSGSGKSTLIRHINRLIEPTLGRILVDGEDVLTLDARQLLELRRHKISMVFQRFALLPHKTVLDNVAYGLLVAGTPKPRAHAKAREQIALVGLEGFEDRYPSELSGGMQQRVGLARALATDAEVLLMDEAFSALDPLIRNDMQAQLKELQERLHKTIVFITHDLDEALRIGDHIAILKDGELRQVGRPSEILLSPADDYVARFVRDVNRARAIEFGSITRPAPVVALEALDPAAGIPADAAGMIVALGEGRFAVITRSFLKANAERPAAWWRSAGNLPLAARVAPNRTIEEGLEALVGTDVPAVVVDAAGAPLGIVSEDDVLLALTGEFAAAGHEQAKAAAGA